MANIRIKDLPLTQLYPQSWVPFESPQSPNTTSKTTVSAFVLSGAPAIWSSAAQTVRTLSGNWETLYTEYNDSDKIKYDRLYTTVTTESGGWENASNDVVLYKNNWNTAFDRTQLYRTILPGICARTDSVYSTVTAGSAVWIKKFTQAIGDNSNTSFTINHNFGTFDVAVTIRETTGSRNTVTPSNVSRNTINSVIITFATIPTTNQYTAIILG